MIGNPPYNAGQVNENDKKVFQTYGKGSKAVLLRKLRDPYVKAIRWASDRIGEEGIVAFVTNNSFIHDITFDAMRRCLEEDFNTLYILDLGGNSRKGQPISNSNVLVFVQE